MFMKIQHTYVFLIAVIMLLAGKDVKAQVWSPPGATWHYSYFDFDIGYYRVEYIGDTLIKGQLCQHLQSTRYSYFPLPNGGFLPGAVTNNSFFTYVSGDTVFYLGHDNLFFQLYNFNARIGDIWTVDVNGFPHDPMCNVISRVRVVDTSSIVINGIRLRTIELQTMPGSYNGIDGIIAERIGPISSRQFFLPTPRFCNPDIVPNVEIQDFTCYSDDNFPVYNVSSFGCESILSSGETDIKKTNVSVELYPNPSSDKFYLEFPNQYFKKTVEIEVYSISGEKVFSDQVKIDEAQYTLDFSQKTEGMYLLRMFSGNNQLINKKLILKKD